MITSFDDDRASEHIHPARERDVTLPQGSEIDRDRRLVESSDALRHLEGAVPAHVVEGRETFRGGSLLETGDGAIGTCSTGAPIAVASRPWPTS